LTSQRPAITDHCLKHLVTFNIAVCGTTKQLFDKASGNVSARNLRGKNEGVNLSQDTHYPEAFHAFSQFLYENSGSNPFLGHGHFLPNSLKFRVHSSPELLMR